MSHLYNIIRCQQSWYCPVFQETWALHSRNTNEMVRQIQKVWLVKAIWHPIVVSCDVSFTFQYSFLQINSNSITASNDELRLLLTQDFVHFRRLISQKFFIKVKQKYTYFDVEWRDEANGDVMILPSFPLDSLIKKLF